MGVSTLKKYVIGRKVLNTMVNVDKHLKPFHEQWVYTNEVVHRPPHYCLTIHCHLLVGDYKYNKLFSEQSLDSHPEQFGSSGNSCQALHRWRPLQAEKKNKMKRKHVLAASNNQSVQFWHKKFHSIDFMFGGLGGNHWLDIKGYNPNSI